MKIKILRTGNEGEYTSLEFELFLQNNGIVHHLTIPYSLQQNGAPRRKTRIVMKVAMRLLSRGNNPKFSKQKL